MKYTLINDADTFIRMAAAWNDLLAESIRNLPFLRHEYLRAWWEFRGGGEWQTGELAIITAERNGKLIGIAPLFRTEYQGKMRLLFLGCIEISDFLDFIVREADLSAFLDGLTDFIASHADLAGSVLDLHNLIKDSPSLPTLQRASALCGRSFQQEILQPAPCMALPAAFDDYLAKLKKKQRHEMRRKLRRAAGDERQISWVIASDKARLDEHIAAFFGLMSNDPQKRVFLTETMKAQMKATIHAAFDAGWLQLAFLEVDGEKAAAYLNFDYDNRIWVYNSGLDMKFADLSPGWVLLCYLIEWAIENKRSEFDFMRGDERYKYKFGGVDRFVVRAQIGCF